MPAVKHYKQKNYMDSYNKTFTKFRLFKKNCRKVNFDKLSLIKDNKNQNFHYLTFYKE